MRAQNGTAKHVALVGVTGVGKSTLVNVLTASNQANVTNDVKPCTAQPDCYTIEEKGVKYTLWDTRGLNEASEQGAAGPIARFLRFLRFAAVPEANHELQMFLRGEDPKISLVLFCIGAEKINVDAHWNNYRKIYVKFCKKKIKVAVVPTRMDLDPRNTGWRKTCESRAREVLGKSFDAGLVEDVPAFERLEDTGECRSRLLTLVAKFS